jgi:Family of unknown function (DUF5990)
MLADVDADLLDAAQRDDRPVVVAAVDLTDDHGGPRCARLRAPAIEWSLGGRSRRGG